MKSQNICKTLSLIVPVSRIPQTKVTLKRPKGYLPISEKKNTGRRTKWYLLDIKLEWMKKQAEVAVAVRNSYEWALENNIAKEQARSVLPEGLTTSRMYMNGTLRSWMHFIELRSGNGTQKEHMEVARECAKVLEPVFPIIKEFVSE